MTTIVPSWTDYEGDCGRKKIIKLRSRYGAGTGTRNNQMSLCLGASWWRSSARCGDSWFFLLAHGCQGNLAYDLDVAVAQGRRTQPGMEKYPRMWRQAICSRVWNWGECHRGQYLGGYPHSSDGRCPSLGQDEGYLIIVASSRTSGHGARVSRSCWIFASPWSRRVECLCLQPRIISWLEAGMHDIFVKSSASSCLSRTETSKHMFSGCAKKTEISMMMSSALARTW